MEPSQLAQVEALATALYQGRSNAERAEAQQQLLVLQSAEFLPQCEYILESSQQPYAQLIAASSLEHVVTNFWNNFSIKQKLDIRAFVLSALATRGPHLQDFVVTQLCKVCGRVTKLGWFDADEFREVLDGIRALLEATPEHRLLAARILLSLVDEMNIPTSGRTLTVHRKVAVSFRDQMLLQVLQLALHSLISLQATMKSQRLSEKETKLSQWMLSLVCQCLSFDFIGTNPEDSAEDVGTIQVPSSWRATVQDPTTMSLLFDWYIATEPPRSQLALEALVQLSSVRRSLFASETDRTQFLHSLMRHVQQIMSSQRGLEHVENYHEFCRLLGRLKANYQLSELVKTPGFTEWLELAMEFTVRSLQNWEYSMNSIHYLLALWGRLVAALPYLRADAADAQRQAQTLRNCVLRVTQSYIQTMLDSAQIVIESDGSVDDPLEDEGSLREQMDRLPGIARIHFEAIAQYMLSSFEQTLSLYEPIVSLVASGSSMSVVQQQQMAICELRLCWLVHMISACIDSQSTSDTRRVQSELVWDGRLSRLVFQLISLIDARMSQSQGRGRCDAKLEIAILSFFKSFKKVYLLDSSVSSAASAVAVPGGSPAHPLLSLALSSYRNEETEGSEIVSIYDAIGLGDMMVVMNLMVTKLCNNIKYWHRSEQVLEETLEVFVELISSYSSSKTLLQLEAVQFLVQNHTGQHFPFLGYDNDNKFRITFYSALTRLVFSSAEDVNNAFDMFVAPNIAILAELTNTDIRQPAAKVAIVAALRDLRGIAVSSYSKRTYNLLFEALYPAFFPLFRRVAETWFHDPIVMTALLKFVQEFVANKGQRIFFENSSANGILLFREASGIVCEYGSRILSVPVQQSIYLEKYKGIRLMLNVLTNALSGNYVNFGVFKLYNDSALQNALDVSLQICLQVPVSDVLAYVKLSRAYFSYLEILFRNHLDVLAELSSETFVQLLRTTQEGLQSNELTVSASCASTIDHVATYLFLNSNRDKPVVQQIRQHSQAEPDLFHQLMTTLFNTLLFGSQANHWAITRPILSLLLASESSFAEYQSQLLSSQPIDNQEKLREEFSKLTADVQRSVETSNRDKFTQKLTMFRLSVRQFLTL